MSMLSIPQAHSQPYYQPEDIQVFIYSFIEVWTGYYAFIISTCRGDLAVKLGVIAEQRKVSQLEVITEALLAALRRVERCSLYNITVYCEIPNLAKRIKNGYNYETLDCTIKLEELSQLLQRTKATIKTISAKHNQRARQLAHIACQGDLLDRRQPKNLYEDPDQNGGWANLPTELSEQAIMGTETTK